MENEHVKRQSIALFIMELQTKSPVGCKIFRSLAMSRIGEDVEQPDLSYTSDGNVENYNYFLNQNMVFQSCHSNFACICSLKNRAGIWPISYNTGDMHASHIKLFLFQF